MSRTGRIRRLPRAAGLYDPRVRLLGFGALWEQVARHAAVGIRGPCLDVCAGTGGVAVALAKRGLRVVGVDAAPGMLARLARRRRALAAEGVLEAARMDARRLAFPDASFESVVCCMALHEMAPEERRAVLSELRRVSRCRVVIAEWAVPPPGASRFLFRIRRAVECLDGDDFGSFVQEPLAGLLEEHGLLLKGEEACGPFRIYCCGVARRAGEPRRGR